MDLRFSDADEQFRAHVRAFFTDEYPQDLLARAASGAALGKLDLQRAERALASRGWLCLNWPGEHGGPGFTANQKYVFDEELERAGAPSPVPMGVIYVGPVICAFGTPEQQARWLPGIRESTTFWAQGYSEPGSGSDLASLQCKAERDGDDYVVTGTKIWTSLAQHADWIFLLVRTDSSGRKQEGITFLCAPMDSPGIAVHPIITIDGKHSLNRVELDGVRIPIANRIGEEGKGWTYANFLLGNERTSYAHVAAKHERLRAIRARATACGLIDDPDLQRRLQDLDVRTQTLEISVLRVLASLADGESPGNESSILKILATELAQDIAELDMQVHGIHATARLPDSVCPPDLTAFGFPEHAAAATASYLGARAQSIYGGANEIQKNIIAKRVLGL